jgi:hypothetical protein
MIHLTKGNTDRVILTLTEKCQLTSPNYLFVFTSREDQTIVKFVILNNADLSTSKVRFNQFNIVTNTYFANSKSGEFEYQIYEQTSSSNLDPTQASGLVEVGQMSLSDGSNFAFTQRNTTNTFKVREI